MERVVEQLVERRLEVHAREVLQVRLLERDPERRELARELEREGAVRPRAFREVASAGERDEDRRADGAGAQMGGRVEEAGDGEDGSANV